MSAVAPTVAVPARPEVQATSALARASHVLALTTIGLAPLFLVVSGDPSTWKRGVILQLVDVVLVALFVVRGPTIAAQARAERGVLRAERGGVTAALVVLWLALALSAAIHPAMTGLMTLARFGGIIALIDVLAHGPAAWRSSAAKLWLGWTVVEGCVAVAQKSLGRAIGVPGEVGIPFETLGTFPVPTGTSYGPHPIAAMGLVAIGLAIFGVHHRLVSRPWAVAGSAAGAVIVGITCGTAGALSLVTLLVAGSMAIVRDRRVSPSMVRTVSPALVGGRRDSPSMLRTVGPVLAVVVVAFSIAAATSIDGWRFKASRTATTDVAAASNGRAGMIDESLAMIRRWPIVGVGPGRFLATRDAHPDIAARATEDQAVHNVPLLIVTESGALGAVAFMLVGIAVVRRLRRQAFALTLLSAMLGHALFDHAPWTFGFGMVQLALVIGFATAHDT